MAVFTKKLSSWEILTIKIGFVSLSFLQVLQQSSISVQLDYSINLISICLQLVLHLIFIHFWSWLKENEDGSWDWELILVLKENLTVKHQNYFIVTFVRSKRTLMDWKLASFFSLLAQTLPLSQKSHNRNQANGLKVLPMVQVHGE